MRRTGFAKTPEGMALARAVDLTGKTPSEILAMEPTEQNLTLALANHLEKDRWEKMQKLHGG